jgi:predicted N-acetyltransferase YhbS
VFDGSIELLAPSHNRRGFTCGDNALDDYLRRFARQHAEAKISRTYVACEGENVLGYYSLAMSAIRKDELPQQYQTRFPNFPLPVARLARLAVDSRHQRQGLGELLLADALYRSFRLSEEIGMIGVVVDAKHEKAMAYYRRFEFESLPDSPLTLWLPAAAIAKMAQ